jgi:hypothetical protein
MGANRRAYPGSMLARRTSRRRRASILLTSDATGVAEPDDGCGERPDCAATRIDVNHASCRAIATSTAPSGLVPVGRLSRIRSDGYILATATRVAELTSPRSIGLRAPLVVRE